MKINWKDILLIEEQSNNIIAIITNKDLKGSEIVARKGLKILEVDNTKDYIQTDPETGEVKYKNPDSKILYLKDYI